MSFRFIPVSGLGLKEPAAFLLEVDGLRLLLDLGQGVEPHMRPDPERIGPVDALVLSHAHKDHVGALDLRERIGSPPVHATGSVLDRIGGTGDKRELPPGGAAEILGIPVRTGRDGHALGGIWIRFDLGGGFLYMGDHNTESNVFPFDPPPATDMIVLDASYAGDEETRGAQEADVVAAAAAGNVHLPVPADGRALEIALRLKEAGVPVAIDEPVRAMLRRLAGPDGAFGRPGAAEAAGALAEEAPPAELGFAGAILTSDGSGDSGASARLIAERGRAERPHLLFTGHLDEGTAGHRLVAAGRARFRRWNVHPTLTQNLALARSVGARIVVPAFGGARSDADWTGGFAPAAVAVGPVDGVC